MRERVDEWACGMWACGHMGLMGTSCVDAWVCAREVVCSLPSSGWSAVCSSPSGGWWSAGCSSLMGARMLPEVSGRVRP